jgi:2-polyprenyl-3-methyl-5-hydroxy-6-metoxy-1,4-benzoquinol methylase
MKTWHETIEYIRTQPEYKELVEKAYFEENLSLNVERFRVSEEYQQTLALIKQYAPQAKTILDIGSGNGISAISFALDGYKVTASEPDPSNTVGAGAVRLLKESYKISDLEVYEEFAENIQFPNGLFDIVYVRQAMHHAYNLPQFIKNLSGLIKPGGILFTVRDHVIYDAADKNWFLENHPLHKFYGGENAFTEAEYRGAIEDAGLTILARFKHYDSVVNYFPLTKGEFQEAKLRREEEIMGGLIGKIGFFGRWPFVQKLYKRRLGQDAFNPFDETKVPGRMYSFIAVKP